MDRRPYRQTFHYHGDGDADRVILVCDNLNTDKLGSLYDTYKSEMARASVKRLEIHSSPKYGSWLKVAECELSAFTRQCLGKQAGSKTSLRPDEMRNACLRSWTSTVMAKSHRKKWKFHGESNRAFRLIADSAQSQQLDFYSR
ncbi:transposase [Thalassoglobus neptunius]|nr:transposase [Thalassoglobus neptunius]